MSMNYKKLVIASFIVINNPVRLTFEYFENKLLGHNRVNFGILGNMAFFKTLFNSQENIYLWITKSFYNLCADLHCMNNSLWFVRTGSLDIT